MKKVLLALCYVSGLVGCATVGPDYQKPQASLPVAFKNEIKTDGIEASHTAVEVATFWKAFNDPILSQLVEALWASNKSLAVAQAHLQGARADARGIAAGFWPTISVNGDAKQSVTSRELVGGSRSSRTHTTYEGTLDMAWEVNLFGRFARAKEYAAAQVSVEEAGVYALQTSLVAELVNHYMGLRGLQAQLLYATQRVQALEALLKAADVRHRYGRSSGLEVVQVKEALENAKAFLPELASGIQQSKDRIALLTGQQPSALDGLLNEVKPLPAALSLGKISNPAALLERRPDIRRAERDLAAATAMQGVRTADFFPSLNITGLIGLNAGVLGSLAQSDSVIHSLGASLGWTMLDFGRLSSRLDRSKADVAASYAEYEETVLIALHETEAALVLFSQRAKQAEHRWYALKAAQEAANLAKARYDAGAVDHTVWIQAEDHRLQALSALTSAQTDQAIAFVTVYKALGGGWKPLQP